MFIHALKGDRVDLDGQPGFFRSADARHNIFKAAPAGDRPEFGFIQRIKRYVHPAHTCGKQLVCHSGQLTSVGGDGHFFKAVGL